MPASHEAIGREIQWTGDGRGIDFHVSVGPSGTSTITTHQAGFTHEPRGGWVSIWEHFVLQVGYAMTERRRYPADPATVRWHDAPSGGIHVHVIVPLTPDPGLAGLQPPYEQFALVVEDLQIKVDRRDRDREQIACTGMPGAPGTPAA
jgi:hypothetical protein